MHRLQLCMQYFILSVIFVSSSTQTLISPSQKIYVAVNKTLDVSCSLGKSNASFSDLYLKKCLPPSNCQRLEPVLQTNNTKYYKLSDLNSVKRTVISYFCATSSNSTEAHMGHLDVVVGYEPQLPENIRCVSNNRAELNCSWDVPEVNLINSVKSFWNVTYTDGALAYRPCPKVTITKYEVPNRFQSTTTSGCYISSDDANIFDRFIPSTNYTFNLTLTNSIGVVSRAYSITISKIVQLSAPRMSIKPSKTTIDITLDLPLEYSIHREYHAVVQYDLTYRPTWSNAVEQVLFSSGNESVSMTLENCVPFTNYTIQMKAKPVGSMYWSDVDTKPTTTHPDVPHWPPETLEGLYFIDTHTPDSKEITLYHKPLQERYWNSENCSVNVVLSNDANRTIWVGNFTPSEASLKMPFDRSDSSYTAALRYINKEGSSENDSLISITNEDNGIFVTVEEIETKGYWITWEMDDVTDVLAATIMWCTHRSRTTCEDDIEWRTFQTPGSGVRLTDIQHNSNMIFGVSVQYRNKTSSGLTFASCYYQLLQSHHDFKLAFDLRQSDNQPLVIDLISTFCQYESRPVTYQVLYHKHTGRKLKCPNDFSSNITEKARHDLREIPMTYLDPTSRYDFCIGVRLANNRTVYSDVQSLEYQDIQKDDGEEVTTALIVVAVFVFVFLTLFLVCYCKRKCTFEDPDINIPNIESYVNPGYNNELSEEGKYIQDMADSGTQSLPESVSSEEQGAEADRDSVSSSGIGSTKCESDVFSTPTTPIDSDKQTLIFKTILENRMQACNVFEMPGNKNQTAATSSSEGQVLSSGGSNPIDSYIKGDLEEDGLNTLQDMMDDSGDFSGGYRDVMCSNYTSTCASDSENIDTCPPTPELKRDISENTLCDLDTMADSSQTFTTGDSSSQSTVPYARDIQIDSSGENVTFDTTEFEA
ncbi:uncharacterized protein LOC125669764 isoform X2 [Ostrea edulis]|uniref:uncharacterized protein LOC125669764 isoform X2 n=1 Tax=Ostrea edulis TaxID=37623 RepID=UPI0024AEA213|nr:uncharacterized protein LOC125669764 isoform X2 [Ostrea edulis]